MVEGLSHVTFVVRNLERMARILREVFDAQEIYASGDATFSIAREKFFLAGGVWIAVMEGASLPARTYNHVAFKIRDEDFDERLERVKALGLEVMPPRPRIRGRVARSIFTTRTIICSSCTRGRSSSGWSATGRRRLERGVETPNEGLERGFRQAKRALRPPHAEVIGAALTKVELRANLPLLPGGGAWLVSARHRLSRSCHVLRQS